MEEGGNEGSMSCMASQISSIFAKPSWMASPLDVMVKEISDTVGGKVLVYGVGREGLMIKGVCMRLGHLGLSAHCVFDITTPAPIIISWSDLLIASAGPGGFPTVDAICGVAKSSGARVLLVTAQPESGSAVKYADTVAYIPAPAQTMADEDEDEEESLVMLPMGSGAMFEMLVYKLALFLDQTPDAIRSRHTNLE